MSKIRKTCAEVMKTAKHVEINFSELEKFSKISYEEPSP